MVVHDSGDIVDDSRVVAWDDVVLAWSTTYCRYSSSYLGSPTFLDLFARICLARDTGNTVLSNSSVAGQPPNCSAICFRPWVPS